MSEATHNERSAEDAAWAELARLCSGAGPAANWRWSIPARPDRDSDLILAAGLKEISDERDRLAAMLAALSTQPEPDSIIEAVRRELPLEASFEVDETNVRTLNAIRDILARMATTQPEALVTEQWGLWNRNAGQWYPDESARVVHEIVPTSRLAKREARTTYGPWEEVTE